VSPSTVRRLMKTGELTKIRVGGSVRLEPADVSALVERGKQLSGGMSAGAGAWEQLPARAESRGGLDQSAEAGKPRRNRGS
jgi:excisionase family DNA binding protein